MVHKKYVRISIILLACVFSLLLINFLLHPIPGSFLENHAHRRYSQILDSEKTRGSIILLTSHENEIFALHYQKGLLFDTYSFREKIDISRDPANFAISDLFERFPVRIEDENIIIQPEWIQKRFQFGITYYP